ncbi:MAG: helix-turn-helix domain-containing protein, partial [Actinomycetota bacterium]|nr:helix-turn-helix domain-containing protein [Actinomycetota bacterium]
MSQASKAQLVITALFIEHQTPAQVAARYGVHRTWVYKLKARYEAEGDTALQPRSRRPRTSPSATPPETIELVLRLRKALFEAGHDAGADTLLWHLRHHHQVTLSRATVHRILTRHGAITPEPKKRPKSSYIRFQAQMPNETWQSDFTHYRLADGVDVEIISWLDDCTRYALHVSAHPSITTAIVKATFKETRRSARHPRLDPDRQRDGLHRPAGRDRPPRRQELLRSRTRPPPHRAEELPTKPPDHLRQGRAVPADDEEVAT